MIDNDSHSAKVAPMLTARATDTVADLAARIREERARPPAPGQIVTRWMYTPEVAAEMMIGAAQLKERLEKWAASVGMDLDGPEAQAEHARRVEAGTPPTERAAFKAQRARCIEAARALDNADEVEFSGVADALKVEMDKLNALDPGPWRYVVAPGHPEPVRYRDRVTQRTTLSDLQARLRQDSGDRSGQLVRSIQGSLRVEGHVVSEAVLRSELAKLRRG